MGMGFLFQGKSSFPFKKEGIICLTNIELLLSPQVKLQ